MKSYWDSSALIGALQVDATRELLEKSEAVTRSHAFAEVFSTLTGGRLGFRVDGVEAADLLDELAAHLVICDLDGGEVLASLREAKSRGVRGGRVHDYLHAMAAVKAQCDCVYTYNLSDFRGLVESLEIIEPD